MRKSLMADYGSAVAHQANESLSKVAGQPHHEPRRLGRDPPTNGLEDTRVSPDSGPREPAGPRVPLPGGRSRSTQSRRQASRPQSWRSAPPDYNGVVSSTLRPFVRSRRGCSSRRIVSQGDACHLARATTQWADRDAPCPWPSPLPEIADLLRACRRQYPARRGSGMRLADLKLPPAPPAKQFFSAKSALDPDLRSRVNPTCL